MAQRVKNLPAMCKTSVQLLGQEDPPTEFHGQRSWAGYSPWGHKESDATETDLFTLSLSKKLKHSSWARVRHVVLFNNCWLILSLHTPTVCGPLVGIYDLSGHLALSAPSAKWVKCDLLQNSEEEVAPGAGLSLIQRPG